MRNHVRFTAPQFSPLEPEAAQVSPGRYGRELAAWLARALHGRGVAVDGPAPEDWGWYLEGTHAGARLFIACGNVDESRTEWLVWVEATPARLLDRLLGRRARAMAARREVVRLVDACLRAEPDVGRVEWHAVDARRQETDHAPSPE